jgi:hypothetical protein
MTHDEVIEMARQAGCFEKHQVLYFTQQDLEYFAKLVAAKEREACAKVCESQNEAGPDNEHWWECASAIRARGEQA